MLMDWKRISADDQLEKDPTPPLEPRYAQRLSDKILIALHQARDQEDIEVARALFLVYRVMSVLPMEIRPRTPWSGRARR
jgi:hypothetical protein